MASGSRCVMTGDTADLRSALAPNGGICMQRSPSFGSRLRWWRVHRGRSQLDLAGAAGTTQARAETGGPTQPSREMVLRLAATLDVPLRQQNALLLAAGFAPVWR